MLQSKLPLLVGQATLVISPVSLLHFVHEEVELQVPPNGLTAPSCETLRQARMTIWIRRQDMVFIGVEW